MFLRRNPVEFLDAPVVDNAPGPGQSFSGAGQAVTLSRSVPSWRTSCVVFFVWIIRPPAISATANGDESNPRESVCQGGPDTSPSRLDMRKGPAAGALILTIPGNPVSNPKKRFKYIRFSAGKPSMPASEGREKKRGIDGPQQTSEAASSKRTAPCERGLWI
jgi:hypothetical protein